MIVKKIALGIGLCGFISAMQAGEELQSDASRMAWEGLFTALANVSDQTGERSRQDLKAFFPSTAPGQSRVEVPPVSNIELLSSDQVIFCQVIFEDPEHKINLRLTVKPDIQNRIVCCANNILRDNVELADFLTHAIWSDKLSQIEFFSSFNGSNTIQEPTIPQFNQMMEGYLSRIPRVEPDQE